MTRDSSSRCPICGATLGAASTEGLCSACLVESVLASDPDEPAPSMPPDQPVPLVKILGEFELLERIGQGGMGVVYKARQAQLDRLVALKLIHSREVAGPDFAERFRIEARAAASLEHPNIVSVFESGEIEGQAFLAMRLVEGRSLDQAAAARTYTPEAAAKLVIKIAGAVHYAHQRGVLHRDLKPGNVLIDQDGEPHLTDFGLARLMEHDSTVTSTLATLGTPSYMAPEQASGGTARATTATDTYGLGAILFEALTGSPPFSGPTTYETVRRVLETDAPRPSILDSRIPADLDTICLKCLSKDPKHRYGTAQELAHDLQRWLNHEPITARPTTWIERTLKWTRRNPALAALIVVCVVGAAGFVAERSRAAQNLRLERDFSIQQQRRAEAVSARLLVEDADRQLGAGRPSHALALFAHLVRQSSSNYVAGSRIVSLLNHRNFALPLYSTQVSRGGVRSLHLNQSGDEAVMATADGHAVFFNTRDGHAVRQPLPHSSSILVARYSPDNQFLLTIGEEGSPRIWKSSTGDLIQTLRSETSGSRFAEFSPDGSQIATCGGVDPVKLWSWRTGKGVRELRNSQNISRARFSPDGRKIVTISYLDGSIRLWDLGTPEPEIVREAQLPSELSQVAWSPDGKRIAAQAEGYETVSILDVDTFKFIAGPFRHAAPISSVEFSRDSRLLCTTSDDRTARVWDLSNNLPLTEPLSHPAGVLGAEILPDSRSLLTVCEDGFVRLWDIDEGRSLSVPLPHPSAILHASFSPDGRSVATVANDNQLRLWNAAEARLIHELPLDVEPLHSVHFSPDSSRVAAIEGAKFVQRMEVREGNSAHVIDVRTGLRLVGPLPHGKRMTSAQFSRDSQYLLAASWSGKVTWSDLRHTNVGTEVVFSGSETARASSICSARLSPSQKEVLVALEFGRAELRSLSPPKLIGRFQHGKVVRWADFSPSGKHVITTSDDHTARLWKVDAFEQPLAVLSHDHFVLGAQFSQDETKLITYSSDRTARLWEVPTGRLLAEPLRHEDQVWSAFLTRDGTRAITTTWAGTLRVWDTRTGLPLTEPLGGGIWKKPFISQPDDARLSPDEQVVLCLFADRSARLIEVPRLPYRVPSWLADLAEAVAGQAFDADRRPLPVAMDSLIRLRERLSQPPLRESPDRLWEEWARWFFANRRTRTLNAWSSLTRESLRDTNGLTREPLP
ncbi:MAG: protein kinase [Verrucomicrobiales bacterium]|nr:protein kinase [Verrucomicrobiales bacterium]